RKCQLPWLQISQGRTETGRSADVLSGLIAVAVVDAAPRPDADHVAFANATFDIELQFGPSFGAHHSLQKVLGHVVSQHATLEFCANHWRCQKEDYHYRC